MSNGKVISADSHVQEPSDLYERLPEKFRKQAPRIEEIDGGTYMIVAGKKPRRVDVATADATEDDQDREFRSDPTGGRDLDRRFADQERDGVCAEVIYPNQSLLLYTAPDPYYQLIRRISQLIDPTIYCIDVPLGLPHHVGAESA